MKRDILRMLAFSLMFGMVLWYIFIMSADILGAIARAFVSLPT